MTPPRTRLHSVPPVADAKPAPKKTTARRASTATKKTQRGTRASTSEESADTSEESAKPKKKSVVEAAQDGTDRELLVAMRDRIAEDLDSRSTSARDLAALSKRLMELQREIKVHEEREQQEGKANGGAVPDEPFDASAV